jgi:hypothetical protein
LKTLDCVEAGVAVGVTLGVNVGVGDGAAAVPPQAATTIADAAMAAKIRIDTLPSVSPCSTQRRLPWMKFFAIRCVV